MAVRTEKANYESARTKESKAAIGSLISDKPRSNAAPAVTVSKNGETGAAKRSKAVSTGTLNSASFNDLKNQQALRMVSQNTKTRVNGKTAEVLVGQNILRAAGTSVMNGADMAAMDIENGSQNENGGPDAGASASVSRRYGLGSGTIVRMKNPPEQEKNRYKTDGKSSGNTGRYEKTSSRLEALKSTGEQKNVRRIERRLARKKQNSEKWNTENYETRKDRGAKSTVSEKVKKQSEKGIRRALLALAGAVGGLGVLIATAVISVTIILFVMLAAAASSSSSGSGSLEGNAAIIYEYFHAQGLGDVQCAAILGNLKQELSSFDPTYDSGNVLGIMQWTGGQRTLIVSWASSQGLNVYDLTTQLRYAWEVYIPSNWYFAQYSGAHAYPEKYNLSMDEWKTTQDLDLATGGFCACSEKPYYMPAYDGEGWAMMETRIQYAQEFLNAIRSGGMGGGSIPGAEVINGVPYYNQGDFADYPFNTGSIASDGCGPTSMAMVASYFTGRVISPVETASWGMANGANPVETWDAFRIWCDHYGLTLVGQYTGPDPAWGGDGTAAVNSLRQGCLVICSQTPGYWTSGGHYIVLTGITSDGRIYVNDPGSRERTAASPYDYGTVFGTCKQYWIITK